MPSVAAECMYFGSPPGHANSFFLSFFPLFLFWASLFLVALFLSYLFFMRGDQYAAPPERKLLYENASPVYLQRKGIN